MSPERIMYIGTLKFTFQGMIANHRGRLNETARRTYWRMAKELTNNYLGR